MFKPKITVIVLLVVAVYNCIVMSLFIMGVLMYLSGSEAWVVWAYPSALGIGALMFVLVMRKKRRPLSVLESLNEKGY